MPGTWIPAAAWLRVSIGCVLASLPSATFAGPACPVNLVTLDSSSTPSTDPTFALSGRNAAGSYNLKSGTVSSSVTTSDVISGSAVDTDDEYSLVGVADGTAIDFTAEFDITGSWNVAPGVPQGDRAIDAWLASDEAQSEWPSPFGNWCCHSNVSNTLTIPLHHVANETFHV